MGFDLLGAYRAYYLLEGLDPNEALDDIYFWDRLGDLPIPSEYRFELIQYLAETLQGQGPFTWLQMLEDQIREYMVNMAIQEAIGEAEQSIDEAIEALGETIDDLFGEDSDDDSDEVPVEEPVDGSGN